MVAVLDDHVACFGRRTGGDFLVQVVVLDHGPIGFQKAVASRGEDKEAESALAVNMSFL